MSNIAIHHFQINNHKCLIPFVISRKALVRISTMAENSNSSCSIEFDDYSFLSGSVNYSTEFSNDLSVSDLSISAEVEVLLYHFEPKGSDSQFISHNGKVVHGALESLSPEQVGNTDY